MLAEISESTAEEVLDPVEMSLQKPLLVRTYDSRRRHERLGIHRDRPKPKAIPNEMAGMPVHERLPAPAPPTMAP
ncbi:MAG: hypothetical protein HOQ36_25595 [Nocardia sp.]|nr:hypothetical protein [Nocardia sp.]